MTSEIFSEIYNKALDILSRREHSVLELKQKLKKNIISLIALMRLYLALNKITY